MGEKSITKKWQLFPYFIFLNKELKTAMLSD